MTVAGPNEQPKNQIFKIESPTSLMMVPIHQQKTALQERNKFEIEFNNQEGDEK